MRNLCRGVLWLGVGSLSLWTHSHAAPGGDEVAAPGSASPQEAFEVGRKALAGGDYRTYFASLTPEIQDKEVLYLVALWNYNAEGMEGGALDNLDLAGQGAMLDRIEATMKKHGLELPKLYAESDKQYLAAHGVDRAKLKADLRKRGLERYFKQHPGEWAEIENHLKEHPEDVDEIRLPPGPDEEPDPPVPELDHEVLGNTYRAVAARIPNKAAFAADASEVLRVKEKKAPKSADVLEGVTVAGDTARGWVVQKFAAGESKRSPRKFRKLKGRWFNDNQAGDFPYYNPENDMEWEVSPSPQAAPPR